MLWFKRVSAQINRPAHILSPIKPSFILASASPRRVELLRQIGLTPSQVIPAEIDETEHDEETPGHLALRLAGEKAAAVAAQHPDAVILAADTVVACGRRILPKAESEQQARACLTLLSGRRHRVYGGIAVQAGRQQWRRNVVTMVRFARLTAADIDAYVASGEWQGKAGGYAIQGLAGAFVTSINGSYTNIVGLCVHTTARLLAAAQKRE